MASQRRQDVLDNYVWTEQKPPNVERRYAKLSPEGIYSLLSSAGKMHVNGATRNVISAKGLLERMSQGKWKCPATAHEGGRPGDTKADPYLHFNIHVVDEERTYHVRCHEHRQGGVVVFQVKFRSD